MRMMMVMMMMMIDVEASKIQVVAVMDSLCEFPL
jgi:hypothetical protein